MFLLMHQPVLEDIEQLMEPAITYDKGEQPLEQQALWLKDFYLKVCIFGGTPPVLYWSLVFHKINILVKSTTEILHMYFS